MEFWRVVVHSSDTHTTQSIILLNNTPDKLESASELEFLLSDKQPMVKLVKWLSRAREQKKNKD